MFCAPSPRLKSRLLLKLLCICLPRRLHRDPSGKGRGPNRANPESEVKARRGGTPPVKVEVEVQIAQTRKAKSMPE